MFEHGGPFKRTATWIAEKVADVLIGGDVLDPRRDGTEIDWDGVEVTRPRRTVVAVMARMNLELALGAANRRLDGALEEEACRELLARVKELEAGDSQAAKLCEGCSVIVELVEGNLEIQISGAGQEFEVFCDEVWNRSKEVREEGTKKPGLADEPGLLK